jgi:serine phosphatase RsbU (regulator of sigma subunit)
VTTSKSASDADHSEHVDSARQASSAIELLLALATDNRHSSPGDASAALHAAALLRDAITDLESMQAALTEALVASQDRLLAMKAFAEVDFGSASSDEAVHLLLDQALALTNASAVLLLEADVVAATAGDASEFDARIARRGIEQAPDEPLRTTAGDSVLIGSLNVDTATRWHVAYFRPADRPFVTADIPLVETINSALGVVLAFDELHRRERARNAVAREHELASALAQSVIDDEPPASASLDLFAKSAPASLAGGDFYVFGQAAESIWFAVGDVAGKGLPAAMLMTRTVSACRSTFLTHRDQSVAEVFTRIEDEVFEHFDDAGYFVTLAVGIIYEESGAVTLANAGHSPVVHVHDGLARSIPASLPPMGIVRHGNPRLSSFILSGDDCLVLGSDGLVEQEDPQEAMFGYDRFTALCQCNHALPTARMGESIFEAVAAFAAGTPASDDSTLVVVKHPGAAQ